MICGSAWQMFKIVLDNGLFMEEMKDFLERVSGLNKVTLVFEESIAEKVLLPGDLSYCEIAC